MVQRLLKTHTWPIGNDLTASNMFALYLDATAENDLILASIMAKI